MLKIGIVGRDPVSNEFSDAIRQSSDFSFEGFFINYPTGSVAETCLHNLPSVASSEKLIHTCDALFFPDVNHEVYHLITLTLKHSKHVLIGNPLNLDFGFVDDLFKLAEEANVLLKVIQTIQYSSVLQAASQYIRNPPYLEIRKESLNSGESLIETLYHCIQPAVYINQTDMKKIQAVSIPPDNGTPDVINARIEFNNGCVANVTSSMYASSDRFLCRIHQEKQSIDIDFTDHSINLTGFDESEYRNSSDPIRVEENYPFADELSCFAGNILNNSFHLNHAQSGYNTYFISRKILEKISYVSPIL